MVDALGEARRVLTSSGFLVDVRPVIAPIVLEVMVAAEVVWAKTLHTYSAPEDIAAADVAARHAALREWLVFETSHPFSFDIYCDSAAELRAYVDDRKLHGDEIPYEELDERRCEGSKNGQPARLRCRRPWSLSTYRKGSS